MKQLIKTVKILLGIGLLIFAVGGGVGLRFSSSAALKAMLVNGTPVICPIRGTEVKLPGRFVAALILGVPIVALLAGWWLLREAYDTDHERGP